MVSEPNTQGVASTENSSLHPELVPCGSRNRGVVPRHGSSCSLKGYLWRMSMTQTSLLTLHLLCPNPSSDSRSEWTKKELSLWVWRGVSILKIERQSLPVAFFSLSAALPQHFYSSCNIPHLRPWVIVTCRQVLSPLLNHKLIENRENSYYCGSNSGKH